MEKLERLGIDPARRPETLAVEQFQQLSESLFHEKIMGERPVSLDDGQETCT